MGSKAAKAGQSDEAIFRLFSNGYKTSRDAYIYNFSRDACAENARKMVGDYMGAMQVREDRPEYSVDDAVQEHSQHVRWDRELKNNLRRQRTVAYSANNVWMTQYRPFVKQHCYVEYTLVNNKYQQDSIFPRPAPEVGTILGGGGESRHLRTGRRRDQGLQRAHGRHDARPRARVEGPVLPALPLRAENRVICVPGIGANKPFSVLVADRMPDLHFLEFGQCFPRWVYPTPRGYL